MNELSGIAILLAANAVLIAPIYVYLNNLNGSINLIRADIQQHDRDIAYMNGKLKNTED